MKSRLGIIIAVAIAIIGATSASASATVVRAGANTGDRQAGMEHFQVLTVQDQPGQLFAEGLWTAKGIVHDDPKIDVEHGTYTNIAKMEYADGKLTFNSAGLTTLTFLGPACTGLATIDGHFKTQDGTGRYENVHGTGTIKGYVLLVFTPVPPSSCSTTPALVLAVAYADGYLQGLKPADDHDVTVRLPV